MTYIQNVIHDYVTQFITGREGGIGVLDKMVTKVKFNPNLKSSWFTSVMQIISNLTMITVMLTGAALIREREQGTVEHLLVMPVVPTEIMLSKILANGVVIVVSTAISLAFVVEWWLQVPVAGSRLLFLGGACVYVFTVAALGIAARHHRINDGPVRPAVDSGVAGHDAAFRQHDAAGKHAGVVEVRHAVHQPDAAFRDLRPGRALSGGGRFDRLAEIVATAAIGACSLVCLYRFRRVIFSG